MSRRLDPRRRPARNLVAFGVTASVLFGLTLALVLIVIPRRYMLHAGLREAGVNFPAEAAPFDLAGESHRGATLAPQETRDATEPDRPTMVAQGQNESEIPATARALGPEAGSREANAPTKGPAEAFWDKVGALVRQGRYAEALPVFQDYLRDYPGDRGARREHAITLGLAGRSKEAIGIFEALLSEDNDPEVRLLLARALRDEGRLTEASDQYAALSGQDPGNVPLALERARALAWGERYQEAITVLTGALVKNPGDAEIRVELARFFYWSGRVEDALGILSRMGNEELEDSGAASLLAEVLAAVIPVDPVGDSTALSFLERAERAQAEDDLELAAALYRRAIRESPEDPDIWLAYADLVQYRLEDLEGARAVLKQMGTIEPLDHALSFRLAQLEAWTGRNGDAIARLEALVQEEVSARMENLADSVGLDEPKTAEAQLLLGDLYRWEGERIRSAQAYQDALKSDSAKTRASAGLELLRSEADQSAAEIEWPRLGSVGRVFSDSDDFTRLDLGVEGVRPAGRWYVSTRAGNRWLEGFHVGGQKGSEQGPFLELETARWWRLGTLRTALFFGVERVKADATNVRLGASLQMMNLLGFRTDLRFEHGPAYPLTVTLQSLFARVAYDRLTANLSRNLGKSSNLALSVDAARLDTEGPEGTPVDAENFRIEGAVSVGRVLVPSLVLGANARGVAYSDEAPELGGPRLYWDPRAMVSGGLFAQWEKSLGDGWQLRGRINPSMAFIHERRRSGFERVPHISAEAGIAKVSGRFRTSLDWFYYQGRLKGYRASGLQLSIAARDLLGGGRKR